MLTSDEGTGIEKLANRADNNDMNDDRNEGIDDGRMFASGTQISGYSSPDQGPFRCDHCVHFESATQACDGPNVMQDPEVPKTQDGRAQVEAGGCCSRDYAPSDTPQSQSPSPGFSAIARPQQDGQLQAPRTTLRSPGSVM